MQLRENFTASNGPQPFQYRIGAAKDMIHVIAEPGSSVLIQRDMVLQASKGMTRTGGLGNGGQRGMVSSAFRAMLRSGSGEDVFMPRYENTSAVPLFVDIRAPYVGDIVAVNLDDPAFKNASGSGTVICQRGAFLAGPGGTDVKIHKRPRIKAGLFGGEGLFMQEVTGHGTVFLHAGGTLEQTSLKQNSGLFVNRKCLVAYSPAVTPDLDISFNPRNLLVGDTLMIDITATKGPGIVWTQTMPLSSQAENIAAAIAANRTNRGWLSRVLRND